MRHSKFSYRDWFASGGGLPIQWPVLSGCLPGQRLSRLAVAVPVALVLSLLAVSSASAQSLEGRVQRLERILDNAALIEIVQRMDSLQTEVRRLRGELEQKNFEIESMRERQRKLYLDTDSRLQVLEEGGDVGLDSLDSLDSLESELDTDTTVLDSATRQAPETGNRAIDQQEKLDYQDAYDLLILGRNAEAIQQFEQFLRQYPNGTYSDNAHYWLGEANYVERRFNAAIDRFNVVIFRFPGSRKVPDARLRKGFSLFELQRYSEARTELLAVESEYRGRSIAALARRRIEQMNNAGL